MNDLNRYLEDAIHYNDIKSATLAIENCADVDHIVDEASRWTALHHAAFHGQVDFGRLLIGKGADLHKEDHIGRTALTLAAVANNIEFMSLLIKNEVDIDQQNKDGMTALHFSAHYGETISIKCLLDNDASFAIRNNLGNTALDLVFEQELLALFLAKSEQMVLNQMISESSKEKGVIF